MQIEFNALINQHCEGTWLWLRDELFEALHKNEKVLWVGGDTAFWQSNLRAETNLAAVLLKLITEQCTLCCSLV